MLRPQDEGTSSVAQSATPVTLAPGSVVTPKGEEHLVARAFEATPSALGICDRSLRFERLNAAARAMLELPLDQVTEHFAFEFIPSLPRSEHLVLAEEALRSGKTTCAEGVVAEPGASGVVARSVSFTPMPASDGEPDGLLVTFTGRRIESTPAHFETFFHDSSYAIASTTLTGRVLSWNAGAEQLFGYSAAEMVNEQVDVLDTADRALTELLGRVKQGVVELEAELFRKDRSKVDASLVAAPVRNAAGEVATMLLVARDVSSRKALEKRVHNLSQLEAVARVAAGVAHDVNNVLTIVNTYTGFVAQGPLTTEQAHDLDVARDAASRGAALVSQLLGLGQNQSAELVVVELGEVARSIDEMLRRTLGRDVELTLTLPSAPLPVKASVGQIDQVLLNLSLNARDAMPRGGRLSVSVRNSAVSPGHPLSAELAPGPYAVISVKDTGTGMDPETLSRIFEPFFTTKRRGEGTGLGLLIVREIVKQLHGAIRVSSKLGDGTEFQVFLPVHEPRPRTAPPPPFESDEARPQTVLVVEDDVTIRSALRRILHAEGYAVLEAADGLEATEVSTNFGGNIDLLLCDLLMPRVDGRQTVACIRETRPDVRVVFVSGQRSAEEAIVEGAGFVQKPFSRDELLIAVKAALDRPPLEPEPKLPDQPVVLLVDDSSEFRDSLARLLEESDLIALSAKSGLHALQMLESQHVDMIVTDQFMPGIDGVRLLELVRHRWPHCQRVLFTAYASSDVLMDAVNRGGAHRVLVKSMHPMAIRDQIEAAVLSAARFYERARR